MTRFGEIVEEEIIKTNEIREKIAICEYVIMPNHVHMIIEINGAGTVPRAPTREQFGKSMPGTIATIIRYIKAGVTRQIEKELEIKGTIWQRNYYEHVIRNEKELNKIINYIQDNPVKWNEDEYNNKN